MAFPYDTNAGVVSVIPPTSMRTKGGAARSFSTSNNVAPVAAATVVLRNRLLLIILNSCSSDAARLSRHCRLSNMMSFLLGVNLASHPGGKNLSYPLVYVCPSGSASGSWYWMEVKLPQFLNDFPTGRTAVA